MTQEQMNRFRKLFELEQKSLIYSHSLLNTEFQLNPEDLQDETDLTSAVTEQSMRMRLRNREALYLKKIDSALGRITSGTFGDCETCQEPIDVRRLEARPTTTHCLDCKENAEKSEQGHADGRASKSAGHRLNRAWMLHSA